jgi:poly(ADP-ribose) glycohydrolase ARH3
MKQLQETQFLGSKLGLAVADALGAPWEGLSAGMIYDMGPASKIVEHEEATRLSYTDDTQMTIGVAQQLIEYGEINIEQLATRFAENYHPDRGYGQGARKIINAIGFGEDWQQLAQTIFNGAGSLGNGAAMRIAPVALLFADDRDRSRLLQQAKLSALPTHTHPIAIDSARIMAYAIALAAHSFQQQFDRQTFLAELLRIAEHDEFQWQLKLAQQLEPFQSFSSFGNSLEANLSVITSIMCFCDCPDDYQAAIARALGQGNDVDTLAAMTGALSGARLGYAAIPQRLIDCMENNHQGRDYLLELSKQLYQRYLHRSINWLCSW